MLNAITHGIEVDIDSVRQYLDLASRTLNRAMGSAQAERFRATTEEREELDRLIDQCKAEQQLISHACDAHQGIDISFIKNARAC
ncbi:hypothetical protein EGM51_10715 [Verrucomicrobia bacterium S94]|nr:hypothetical protein EGM51_10715 [Verrucomicrobia bacterium S94]